MPHAKPPTIKDVAALAGCAISTVSAALKGDGKVRPATRETILAAVTQLGYRPNRAAASLAAREFRTPESVDGLPVVYLTCVPPEMIGPYVRRSVQGVEQRARELGYRFEHVNFDGVKNQRALCRNLHHRGVAGIILGRTWPFMPADLDFDWSLFAVVRCARDQAGELPVHTVEPDIFPATLRCISEAWKRGYRRIGCVLRAHDPRLSDDDARFGALPAAYERNGIPTESHIAPLTSSFSRPDAQYIAEFHAWFRHHQPDCVIGFSPMEHWLVSTVGRVPGKDIGFACLHAEHENEDARRITGILQDRFRLGVASMELLDQQIRYRHFGPAAFPTSVQVVSAWQEGDTLPRR